MADNDDNLLNYIIDQENQNKSQKNELTNPTSEITLKTDNDNNLTLVEWKNKLEKIFIPYPNKEEIPILIINNKDCFFNGEKITQLQLPKTPLKYDIKFNKCKKCNVNYNKYFCKKCRRNICEICSKTCSKDIDLSNLNIMQKLSDFYTKEIKDFLKKIEEDSEKVPFVFYLIKSIIARKYNNYFHYKNIYECHRYCQSYENKYKYAFLKIIYSVNEDINAKEKDYQIFGKIFVENNKDKISLVINGVESPLVETIKINDTDKSIEVALINKPYNSIEDLSYMFCNCKSESIKIIEIKNSETFLISVINISNMFNNCSYLKDIDLHFFHIFENVLIIDSLFSGCKELENILNLTHLNTTSVTKMDRIFNSCNKLTKIDDIYKFNTDNVESFDEMFKDCSLLEELPKDISDWKMGKAKSFIKMFKGCSSLKEIPYIKGWEGLKVQNVERMFEGCSALKKLPNIGD